MQKERKIHPRFFFKIAPKMMILLPALVLIIEGNYSTVKADERRFEKSPQRKYIVSESIAVKETERTARNFGVW